MSADTPSSLHPDRDPGNRQPSAKRPVRTRFAPSPTGFLHIGGARTALYAWAFARHFDGRFVLRIEDTDVERSTPQAVQAILDGMAWLGLHQDEGPFHQMQRMDRYRQVLDELLADGRAYRCWSSPQELEQMREAQRARGDKPRYDGRWRPERARAAGLVPPEGVQPVLRFRNPDDGDVVWDDLVLGPLSIANAELDDLVIARADGTPTYNFCVVVDDLDMRITHVIRGNDHVNNTPRQINIFRALGQPLPVYGHLPMIHGPDGQKLSKRHGAVSVMQYDAEGYLPEAVLNYLARLGWSHGDDEIFGPQQIADWFDGTHLSQSPAQLDFAKLRWVNQQHLKATDDVELARLVARFIAPAAMPAGAAPGPDTSLPEGAALTAEASLPAGSAPGAGASHAAGASLAADPSLPAYIGLLKERCATLVELADALRMFSDEPPAGAIAAEPAAVQAAFASLADALRGAPSWDRAAVAAAMKTQLSAHGLKMPQLAMPLRRAVFGREQTPSVDAMLAALPRDVVLTRLARAAG